MSEAVRPKKTKKKIKTIDDNIPELPDLSQIEILDDNNDDVETGVEIQNQSNEKVEDIHTDNVTEENVEDDKENEVNDKIPKEISLNTDENEVPLAIGQDYIEENDKIKVEYPDISLPFEQHQLNSEKLPKMYPSICHVIDQPAIINVENNDERNALDVVTEAINAPEAPVAEWILPAPLPVSEILKCYENSTLNHIEELEKTLINHMNSTFTLHPLYILIENYRKAIQSKFSMECKLKDLGLNVEKFQEKLWTLIAKTGVGQGKCRDNAIARTTYSYTEAIFDKEAGENLQLSLDELIGSNLDNLIQSKYELGLRKSMIQDFITRVCTEAGSQVSIEIRQCLLVVFCFVRRYNMAPSGEGVTKDFNELLEKCCVLLGSHVSKYGSREDRLYLLWEILHCPPGVGKWGAGLVQFNDDCELAMAGLDMLFGGRYERKELLSAGSDKKMKEWDIVDIEDEMENDEECGSGDTEETSECLLRESDMIALLDQFPILEMFKNILGTDEYNPTAQYTVPSILQVISFCLRTVNILDRGLSTFDRPRYRVFSKRIGQLIKLTIQFITDHIECILWSSSNPDASSSSNYLSEEAVLFILSQYELVHRNALMAILRHPKNDVWQVLPDIPTRMLSPLTKQATLWLLVSSYGGYTDVDDIFLSNWSLPATDKIMETLQAQLESMLALKLDSAALYLLTTLSNMICCESRAGWVPSETNLMYLITTMLFQACYLVPSTRQNYAKLGRELLSAICLQYPQAISIVLDNLKLWHPSVGQMSLFLLHELPICLWIPQEMEFRLISQWLVSPTTQSGNGKTANQIARYFLSNLNWAFSRKDETCLYLPLSLHQTTAALLANCYQQHVIEYQEATSGLQSQFNLIAETTKTISSLWWYNNQSEDTSIAAWCMALVVRLRLHPLQRSRVTYQACLQQSPILQSPEWSQIVTNAQQERCNNPVAMYVAAMCRYDWVTSNTRDTHKSTDDISVPTLLNILYSLVTQHQQHRLALELLCTLIQPSTSSQLSVLLDSDKYLNLWYQLLQADNTYYNTFKNLLTNQRASFPGPVLACVSKNLCTSLIMQADNKSRQDELMGFFIQSCVKQNNWYTQRCFLWMLEKLLELSVTLELTAGKFVFLSVVRENHSKQWQDASKRSALSQMFRFNSQFNSLASQLATVAADQSNSPTNQSRDAPQQYPWLQSYLIEAHMRLEEEEPNYFWPLFCTKLLHKKKKYGNKASGDGKAVVDALNSTCKLLKMTGLNMHPTNGGGLAVVQAAQAISNCPSSISSGLAIFRLCALFFNRYLSDCDLWEHLQTQIPQMSTLIGQGSVGHRLFQQDDICLPILLKCRANIASVKGYFQTLLNQTNATDITRRDAYHLIVDTFETFLLWIDEPRLHMSLKTSVTKGLPPQFKSDLIDRMKRSKVEIDCISDFRLPVHLLLESQKKEAAEWTSRNDLDMRFLKLAEAAMRNKPVPIHQKLHRRFQKQIHSKLSIPNQEQYILNNVVLCSPQDVPDSATMSVSSSMQIINPCLELVNRCASKYRSDKCFLADINKRYYGSLISRMYEKQTVTRSVQADCGKGGSVGCTGRATIPLNYYTWVLQGVVSSEITRNRSEFKQLFQETTDFNCLNELLKMVLLIEFLIRKLEYQFRQIDGCNSNSNALKCALELFYSLGEQRTEDNQKYPPFKHLITSFMERLGEIFLPFATKQAPKLLHGMLNNELLVDVYCASFCPTIDVDLTSRMYLDLMNAYKNNNVSPILTCTILSKFNISNFIERGPSISCRMNLVESICTSLTFHDTHLISNNSFVTTIEAIHIRNLKMLFNCDFNVVLIKVLEKFRDESLKATLGGRFWQLISDCIDENIEKHGGEMSLSIDELRSELETMSRWLQQNRFSEISTGTTKPTSLCLYSKLTHDNDAIPLVGDNVPLPDNKCIVLEIVQIYRKLLHSFIYKLTRSAAGNIMPWNQAIASSWDYFLQMFIPWLQAFAKQPTNATDAPIQTTNVPSINLPWQPHHAHVAKQVMEIATELLTVFIENMQMNLEGQIYLLQCVLMWIVNGLLGVKDLHESFHDIYAEFIVKLSWNKVIPTYDIVAQFFEVFMRPWSTEKSKVVMVQIASQMNWAGISKPTEAGFITQIFEFIVTLICKTRLLFRLEEVDKLADSMMELDWENLPPSNYKRGMSQLVANLKPSIILANESTIEGKVIKLLYGAAGQISLKPIRPNNGEEESWELREESVIKQTVYIETVVRLLSVAFSFTSTSTKSTDPSSANNKTSNFQLRVTLLFTEIENIVMIIPNILVANNTSYHTIASLQSTLALSLLAEVMSLFRNTSIVCLASEPAITWIRDSMDGAGESPLILPFIHALFKWPPSTRPSFVSLLEPVLTAYLGANSKNFDGSLACWSILTSFVHPDTISAQSRPNLPNNQTIVQIKNIHMQLWQECINQSAIFCMIHQLLLLEPIKIDISTLNDCELIQSINTEPLQNKITEALDHMKFGSTNNGPDKEKGLLLLVGLFLRLVLVGYSGIACKTNNNNQNKKEKQVKPGNALKSAIQELLRMSESKKSSGLLGKVGLGKKSPLSFETRLILRSVAVFLQVQLPNNGCVRMKKGEPGGVNGVEPNANAATSSKNDPIPASKTIQNLEWLKSQRNHKEINSQCKKVLEKSLTFICNLDHCLLDSLDLLRMLCSELWGPNDKLLLLIHSDVI